MLWDAATQTEPGGRHEARESRRRLLLFQEGPVGREEQNDWRKGEFGMNPLTSELITLSACWHLLLEPW